MLLVTTNTSLNTTEFYTAARLDTSVEKRAPELDLEFHGGNRFHGVVLATGVDDDDLDPRLVLDTHPTHRTPRAIGANAKRRQTVDGYFI